jgi:uncharacterized membrane protein
MISVINIDNFTIISSAILLLVAIVSSFICPYLRFKKGKWERQVKACSDSLPPLSVILTPHDQPEALERNLPSLMEQKYDPGFQIIVVVEKGEGETEEVLKRFQRSLGETPSNCSIYVTYIPKSSRYVSRKKLAMTLGVKAAKTEWLLLTEPTVRPASDTWLQTMAENCTDDNSLVVGYGAFNNEASVFKRFERLNASYYLMRDAAKGNAYAAIAPNIMIRKSEFMERDGFRGNLNLIHGEYDFLVNKYSEQGRVALETRDEAWTIEDAPSQSTWKAHRIIYAETRKWLDRSFSHRFLFNIDQVALHISFLMTIVGMVWGGVTTNIILLAASALAFIVGYVLRTVFARMAMSAFDEPIPLLLLYPFQISVIWKNLGYLLRHKFSNKLDFTTHKQ